MIMHERHISAVLIDSMEGLRVLVFVESSGSLKELMDDIVKSANEDGPHGLVERVIRVNGGERIDLATGSVVRFATSTTRLRGSTYDHAFVPLGISRDFLDEIKPALITSEIGQITGY